MDAVRPVLVRELNHYNIRAPLPLLETLRQFYAELLGLLPGPRPPFPTPGYWLYAGRRDVLHLTGVEAPGGGAAPAATGWLGHIAFRCNDDPAAARARLQAMGVPFEEDAIASMRQVQLFFTDPAGIRVELNFDGCDPA